MVYRAAIILRLNLFLVDLEIRNGYNYMYRKGGNKDAEYL